jgi:hypothetical protein
MLSFEVNNEFAHLWGKAPSFLFRVICRSLRKQACHAMFFKLPSFAAH